MKINSVNTNFSGNLYLKNSYLWTDKMKNAIYENERIQEKLQNNDVIGKLLAKKEKSAPSYCAIHRKGDTIYKVKLIVKKEPHNFIDKIKNLFNSKTYNLGKHFHSENTIVNRIKNF